jgi:hypothetical protein
MGINESVFANAASMLIKKSGLFIRDCVFTFVPDLRNSPFTAISQRSLGFVGGISLGWDRLKSVAESPTGFPQDNQDWFGLTMYERYRDHRFDRIRYY